jgi:hypothetical protein
MSSIVKLDASMASGFRVSVFRLLTFLSFAAYDQ